MREKFFDWFKTEGPNLPNRFTIALGELIRQARLDAKLGQAELAEQSYLKQSSISKIEAGTRSVSTEELLYLSYALDKPIGYFFPAEFVDKFDDDELSVLEKDLLIQARRLDNDDLEKMIAQARALAEFEKKK